MRSPVGPRARREYLARMRERYENVFLPSVKLNLIEKRRVGARIRRRYDAPRTPLERVERGADVDAEKVRDLRQLRTRLDPFMLAQRPNPCGRRRRKMSRANHLRGNMRLLVRHHRSSKFLALVVGLLLLVARGAAAQELHVMTSGGFTAPFLELIPGFERDAKTTVSTSFGASMGGAPDSIPSRLTRGETADVVIRFLSSSAAVPSIRKTGLESVSGSARIEPR